MEINDDTRERTKKVLRKIFTPPNHVHIAVFGAEMSCPYCNPYCYKNHANNINWCGHPDCPMNPARWKKSAT